MSHVIGSIAGWLPPVSSWCARSNDSLIIWSHCSINCSLCFDRSDNLFSADSISEFTSFSFCIVSQYSSQYISHTGKVQSLSSNQKWFTAKAHNQTNTMIKNKFFTYHIYIMVSKINLAAVPKIRATSTMLLMYVLFQSISNNNTKLPNAIISDDSIGLVIHSSSQTTIIPKYGKILLFPIGCFLFGYLGKAYPQSICWFLERSSPALSINSASFLANISIFSSFHQDK